MKYFLDTEFIQAPNYLEIISIGIVCEDGREIYCESKEVNWARAPLWVIDNVKPHLNIHSPHTGYTKAGMAETVAAFAASGDAPEFWGYYAAFDWVALCWLMGGMMSLPNGWPMFCRDLRQALDAVGLEHVKQPDDAPHHALSDARWVAETYKEHFPAPPQLRGR